MAATETKKLKQKLTWLTGNVLVCGKNYGELPDVEVSNLKKT